MKRIFKEPPLSLNIDSNACREIGKKALAQGKVASILLSGGMGSRLGRDMPKGCLPFFEGRSLFEIFANKVKESSLLADFPLEVAIMTSPLNDVSVKEFFQRHQFFGVEPSQITFFSQSMLPLLDCNDQPVDFGPSGNGDIYKALALFGILKKWRESGIETVLTFPIENPLAEPFDLELIGYHQMHKHQVTLRGAKRERNEKAGLIVEENGKLAVIEYIEEIEERLENEIANLGLYAFDLSFLSVAASIDLPLHAVKKNAKIRGVDACVTKFERFIFDAFFLSTSSGVILSNRERYFSPIKSDEDIAKALSLFLCKV